MFITIANYKQLNNTIIKDSSYYKEGYIHVNSIEDNKVLEEHYIVLQGYIVYYRNNVIVSSSISRVIYMDKDYNIIIVTSEEVRIGMQSYLNKILKQFYKTK